MILHQTEIEQTVDREERDRFAKELVITRAPSDTGDVPLAMVRKRHATRTGPGASGRKNDRIALPPTFSWREQDRALMLALTQTVSWAPVT